MRALEQETKSHLASKAAEPPHFLGKPKEVGGGLPLSPPSGHKCVELMAPLPEEDTQEVTLCETVLTEIVELYLSQIICICI